MRTLWTLAALCLVLAAPAARAQQWTAKDLEVIRSLSLASLPPLPADPNNPVADDPRAVEFGHRLFFDTRLSANNAVACATCHNPAKGFTDGRHVAEGIGVTKRNTPTLIGIAYSKFFFWDGRKDSLWSQALGPMENPDEHGMTRDKVIEVVRHLKDYRDDYTSLFGPLPDPEDGAGVTQAFINIGRVLEAYERRLVPAPSRFDRYAAALLRGERPTGDAALDLQEELGLQNFIDTHIGNCIECHSGPLFTDFQFHNIGSDRPGKAPEERGRFNGVRDALADEFGCASQYEKGASCVELVKAETEDDKTLGAFKTPTLRNLAETGPYMHTGRIETIDGVLWHYRDHPPAAYGKSEIGQLIMSPGEFAQIGDFLRTLESPVAAPTALLQQPPDMP